MSKLYEALKRLNGENHSPNFYKFSKKPEKKNTKWYILFFVSIVLGSLLIYLSNMITKSSKPNQTLKITAINSTNTTEQEKSTNVTNTVNATKSINTANATGISPKKEQLTNLSYKTKISQNETVPKVNNTLQYNTSNNTSNVLSITAKQEQLKNILQYQQEKGEKLANLALEINQSLENNDLYRAKLLLKEYLSIQEDPFALNDLAGIYIKEGKYTQAVELLNKSIKKEPSASAYINLIYCYKKLNETSKLNQLLKVLNPAIFSEPQKAIVSSIVNSK